MQSSYLWIQESVVFSLKRVHVAPHAVYALRPIYPDNVRALDDLLAGLPHRRFEEGFEAEQDVDRLARQP